MAKAPAAWVREGLKAYADRGVFRSFSEKKGRDGKIKFGFRYLGNEPVTLEFTEKDHTLVVRNMLKRVPDDIFADLQDLLEELHDLALPEHRRIDRSYADVQFVKKGSNVSLVFKVKENRYEYGVDKLINLTSWVDTHLHKWHPEYTWEVMGVPED